MRTNKTNNSVKNLLSLTVLFTIIFLAIFTLSFSLTKVTFAWQESQSGRIIDTGFEEGKFELENEEGGFFNYVYSLTKQLETTDLSFHSRDKKSNAKFQTKDPGENEVTIERQSSKGDPNLWGALNYKIPDKIKAIMAKYPTATFKYEISTSLTDVDSEKLYSTALSAVAASGMFSSNGFYVHDKDNGNQLNSTVRDFKNQYGVEVEYKVRASHKGLTFNQERTLKQSDNVISALFYEHTWGSGYWGADKKY